MVRCRICSKDLENNKGLSYHVSQAHDKKFCDYLVETDLDGKWPTCACGCGEKVNFFGGKFAKHIGSHGTVGLKRSEATRRKISEIQRGKKLTEEHKNKIREGVQLRYSSEDSVDMRAKISKTHKGKSLAENHRKKLSEDRKAKIASGDIVISRDKISQAITQKYLDGGFEWSTGQYTSTKTGALCNYRSSWELELMQVLDTDDRVESWRYEPISIPYVLEGKTRRYVPDFHIVTTSGADLLVEVKPPALSATETNTSKRQAAVDFCARNGWTYFEWSRGSNLPLPA